MSVFETPVLWQPQDDGGVEDESQAHPTPDAHTGHRSPLSKPEFKRSTPGHPVYP